MPTPFAVVVLGLLVVAAVVGLALWARRTSRRGGTAARGASAPGTGREAPWDENTAAAQHTRQADRGGWGS